MNKNISLVEKINTAREKKYINCVGLKINYLKNGYETSEMY